MNTFAYKGFDRAGRARAGLVEALDPKQARERLAADGILAEHLAPAGTAAGGPGSRRPAALSLDQRALLYRELVALLQAGIPLVPAFGLLIQAPDFEDVRPRLASVRDALREGRSLAAALAGAGGGLHRHELAVIEAGERAGTLDTVLARLAGFLDLQAGVRDQIVTALIYPALIVLVALGIAAGLLGVALPRLGALFLDDPALPLPLLTRVVMGTGRAALVAGLPLLAAAAIALGIAAHRLRRDPARAAAWHGRLLRLPLAGPGWGLLAALRFARTLALLLNGGVPLVDGLRLAGEATGNLWIAARTAESADAVRHGSSLADAVRRLPPLDVLAGWVQVGETSGTLPALLESAADRLERRWQRFLARRLNALEPLLILGIGLFVLVVVLAILLPILTLNQRLG